jgi:hypothetical protein
MYTVIHHLDPVALGGTNEAHRLITLCWSCHDLVHEGKLSVKGQAPDDLVWGREEHAGDERLMSLLSTAASPLRE